MQYPKDPLSEKDIGNVVVFCLKAEPNYKSFSDKIVKSCMKDNATPLKVQKAIIDKIKEIIKAAPKKHAALEKFYCLKLLNKIILKKNTELNKHVENKIMERLTIFAEFNNNKDEAKSAQGLLTRGKNIFGPDEKDQSSSANFLIILLDCIEKWALTFQFSEDVGGENKFYKSYKQLLDKGVKFPSSFKQAKKQAEDDNQSMASTSTMNLEGHRSSIPSSQKNTEAQSSSQSNYDDNQSDAQSMASSASSITPEKKAIIAGLKKKMQGVKEASKKAKKLMDELDLSGLDGPATLQQINEGISLGEVSINELMSDEIAQHISNSESLLEKMLSYQETLQNAKVILQDYFDNHQEQPGVDRSNFKTNVDPGMDVQNQQINFNKEQFSTEQIQPKNQSQAQNDFNFGGPQHSQAPSSDFNFGGSNDASGQGFNFGEQSHQQNPYDYEGHANKEMFATQINKSDQFQDFHFGGHNQEEMIQPRDSVKSVAQNNHEEAKAQFGHQGAQRDSVQPQNSLATEVLDQEEVQHSHVENDADVDKFEDCENNEDDNDENRPTAKQFGQSKSVQNTGMHKGGSGQEQEQQQPEAGEMNFDMPPPSNQNQFNDFNFGAASQAPAPNAFDEFSFPPPPDADKQEGNPENQYDQPLKKQNYGTFGTNQADVEFKFDN